MPVIHREVPLNIFAAGDPIRLLELKQKLGAGSILESVELPAAGMPEPEVLIGCDLFFDLNLDDDPSRLAWYAPYEEKMVLACSVKKTLLQMRNSHQGEVKCRMIGMNALPTFINRPVAEISLVNKADDRDCEKLFKTLQWNYQVVADREGMITPGVIAMIINEACFALAEKTASMHDIDLAMKLGTNYPFGPFEWCDRIGIKEVFETLEAIAQHHGEKRYRICPLLREKYLLREPFYQPDLKTE